MKSLNNKTFLQQICFDNLATVTGVATLLLGLHGFFQSLAAKYFLTLILWDFSVQCGLGFFIILHLLGLQMSLPVRRFCVRVALIRTELGCGRRLLWLCFSFRVAVEECWSDLVPIVCTFRLSVLSGRLHWSLRSGFVCEERDLKRAAFSLLNRCKVWIVSENQSLGSMKTDLCFHNWLLDN